ncbi:MAG: amino acid ABC transporter, partial [Epulopiscium sp.]|nr:amino acid ABC transporter [Candidatus Epulonipiscium sp.]
MNKFMKKVMAISLTVAMIFSLAACGEKNQPGKTEGPSEKG